MKEENEEEEDEERETRTRRGGNLLAREVIKSRQRDRNRAPSRAPVKIKRNETNGERERKKKR